ncbi:MAG: deoxyribose-phosphate aldolase [Deltaproteobacteria bacterium]|nr:deoxyribose-phosphate aldolase [Deltaproteobacteria bacterium]
MTQPTALELSKMLDHSLLNPTLTEAQLVEGCAVAREFNAATAMVLPYFLPMSVDLLAGSSVVPSTVIGFPHGSNTTTIKVAEAKEALVAGAVELDMVVNISKVRNHDWSYVQADIKAVNDITHAHKAKLKVIFENAYLSDDEKIQLCELCAAVNVDWVKTSTGYAPTGATEADIILMRKHTPAHIQIKAAGGVRTLDAVLRMRELGCSRVGATATKAIMDEFRTRFGATP